MNTYLSTVALEKNRWSSRIPSLLVSDYLDRLTHDGFSGIELWENHYVLASKEEQKKICSFPGTIIFNTYASFENGITDALKRLSDILHDLHVSGVKFNFGKNPEAESSQIETLLAFLPYLPENTTMLCECHPGTVAEKPENAKKLLDLLPADRFKAIVHLSPENGYNAKRFALYPERIIHLHCQLRHPGQQGRSRLDAYPGIASDRILALQSWGFRGSASIEFTEDGNSPDETYLNCVRDCHFLQEVFSCASFI